MTASEASHTDETPLPKPFYDDWPRPLQGAARALWAWHLHLMHAPEPDGGVPDAFYEAEREQAAAGGAVQVVPPPVWQAAYEACETYRLPRVLLAEQVAAARYFSGPAAFDAYADLDAFLQQWAVPHARLLARLADAGHSWQLPYVDELARGFFFVGRLVELPQDLARKRLFIPTSDLEQAGVTVAQLQAGEIDEGMRRLLWKQVVRARDAFAHGFPLVNEVSPRTGRALKRWGLGALEVLNEIQRRDYDLWSKPIRLSFLHRLQVRFQARLGRAAFRVR